MSNLTIYSFRIIFTICIATIIGCSGESVSPSVRGSESSGNDITGGSGGSGQGGSTAKFTLANNHLYLVTENALFTYSLDNPSEPEYKSQITVWGNVETLFSMNSHLFLGTQNGVVIYSIANPNNPTLVSTYAHVTSCDPVVAQNNFAYSTLRTASRCNRGVNRLDVINITNMAQPLRELSLQMANPQGLGITQDFLFVCDNSNIRSYSLSNPSSPEHITDMYFEGCFDVIINGDVLIATSSTGVRQYTIETNGTLTTLGTISVE